MNIALLALLGALNGAQGGGLGGIEAQVVFPKYEDSKGLAFTGSFFYMLPNMHGALENGVFLKPGVGSSQLGHADQSFGYFMGYTFIPKFPLLRPGLFAGINYDKWISETGPEWRIAPYFGVKAQISILSLSFSGRGIGAGLNFGI